MKNFAIAILLVILLSIVIEPLVEMMEVGREKILLNSALYNSYRVAVLSLDSEMIRDLDARTKEDALIDKFSGVFEEAMIVSRISRNGNTLVFSSIDGKYNDITVTVNVGTDWLTDRERSIVRVKAETRYKFKTKYLKAVSGTVTDYFLTSDKEYTFSIKN